MNKLVLETDASGLKNASGIYDVAVHRYPGEQLQIKNGIGISSGDNSKRLNFMENFLSLQKMHNTCGFNKFEDFLAGWVVLL